MEWWQVCKVVPTVGMFVCRTLHSSALAQTPDSEHMVQLLAAPATPSSPPAPLSWAARATVQGGSETVHGRSKTAEVGPETVQEAPKTPEGGSKMIR